MSALDDADANRRLDAYLTTEMADGPRTPVSAERIVVCLGQDDAGRPLELSIVLKDPAEPGVITLYSINEPILDQLRLGWIPVTTVKSIATNVFQVAIRYESINELVVGAPSPPKPAAAKAICSFCHKKHPETGPLVEGAGLQGTGGIFICRTCTELCLDIFEQERQ
jgi:hypothetical protein